MKKLRCLLGIHKYPDLKPNGKLLPVFFLGKCEYCDTQTIVHNWEEQA